MNHRNECNTRMEAAQASIENFFQQRGISSPPHGNVEVLLGRLYEEKNHPTLSKTDMLELHELVLEFLNAAGEQIVITD